MPLPLPFFGRETRQLLLDDWPRRFGFLPELWLRLQLFLPLDEGLSLRCELLTSFGVCVPLRPERLREFCGPFWLSDSLNDIPDRFFG